MIMHYKIVKLKTGETLLCSMEDDVKTMSRETFLELIDPVEVIKQRESRKGNMVVGESFLLRPWIGLSDNDEFVINADIVLTIGNLKKEVKQQYIDYVKQTAEVKQKVKDYEEREEAVFNLLKDVTPGEVKFVDDVNYLFNEDYDDYGNRN